jgi:hypothetical protein
MRYLATTLFVLLLLAGIAAASFAWLAPAPIRAEYWVGETMAVKAEIVRRHAGERKILVLSGSNTLFNVDTATLTRALGEPVINLGLHMYLPLDQILAVGDASAARGDVLVLPLEPRYYCEDRPIEWQIRNEIAWDRGPWDARSLPDKLRVASHAGPAMPFEILLARVQQAFFPHAVAARLRTLDAAQAIARFDHASPPTGFAYAVDHLDALGNMRATASVEPYRGAVADANAPVPVCADNVRRLAAFAARMRARGVRVYLANTPSVLTDHVDRAAVARAAATFAADVSGIAPLLDSRDALLFPPADFFNSDLHLNAAGRAVRTRLLLDALRRVGVAAPAPASKPELS